MSRAYYNENNHFAATWLRNLIVAGHIARGDVDERSIEDVSASDLDGYTQHHFFAGIGGWSLALRLAGWPDDQAVWTGSCPCQPFSVSGKRNGTADKRHLWPQFRRLIAKCTPAIVFGEQVASADGRQWLDGVRLDLEELGHAVGGADLCAPGQGAPHIRQRLWWVASADGGVAGDGYLQSGGQYGQQSSDGGAPCRLVDADCAAAARLGPVGFPLESEQEAGRSRLADAWADYEIVRCADGKARRTQPGLLPVAHGIPNRLGRLHGYGNAIVPQVAADFVLASIEAIASAGADAGTGDAQRREHKAEPVK